MGARWVESGQMFDEEGTSFAKLESGKGKGLGDLKEVRGEACAAGTVTEGLGCMRLEREAEPEEP